MLRVASVVRGIAWFFICVVVLLLAAYITLSTHGADTKIWGIAGAVVACGILYAIGYSVAWVIEGFAHE